MVLAGICVPWMWLIKPLYQRHQQKHGQVGQTVSVDQCNLNMKHDEKKSMIIIGDVIKISKHG